jgi:hypothetical protein
MPIPSDHVERGAVQATSRIMGIPSPGETPGTPDCQGFKRKWDATGSLTLGYRPSLIVIAW